MGRQMIEESHWESQNDEQKESETLNQIERVLSREVEGSEGGGCNLLVEDNKADWDVLDKLDIQGSRDSILLQGEALQRDSLLE